MKKIYLLLVSFFMISSMALTSCKGDDEDGPEVVADKDLVSSKVPLSEGWSGNSQNGVLKYAPEDYEEDEINSYFAFSMKDGECDEAVYNIVAPDALTAKLLATQFNSGKWVGDMDFDDDDDDVRATRSGKISFAQRVLRQIKKFKATRADFTLPIPVKSNGNVLYIVLPNVKGVNADELKKVVEYWAGDGYVVPDHVLFGEYKNGVYTCKNMHGMNIDYVINTAYNSNGICTKYTTTMTFPTKDWATFYYEIYESQLDDFEESFGCRPELARKGNSVILDAVIIGDVNKTMIDQMIYTIDWMNNCPLLFNMFS